MLNLLLMFQRLIFFDKFDYKVYNIDLKPFIALIRSGLFDVTVYCERL